MSSDKTSLLVQPETELDRSGVLFILSAPSGAGKTTLARRILASVPDMVLSLSYTTRPPRAGEVDGKDYRFVSEAEFRAVERNGGFVEWALVHGDLYGTPEQPLSEKIREGRDMLLDIDVQGTRQIKQRYPDSVAIFLLPPSQRALEDRLRLRGTDMTDRIHERLQNAQAEIRQLQLYDFVVINEEIHLALEKVLAIICAERHRVSRLKSLRIPLWNS
jgi:guanylate kinase